MKKIVTDITKTCSKILSSGGFLALLIFSSVAFTGCGQVAEETGVSVPTANAQVTTTAQVAESVEPEESESIPEEQEETTQAEEIISESPETQVVEEPDETITKEEHEESSTEEPEENAKEPNFLELITGLFK